MSSATPRPPESRRADPKYRHYTPKNLAVVRIDGRDVYLGRYDSPESWEKYYRLLAERRTTGRIDPAPYARSTPQVGLSINELLVAFWNRAEVEYRRADGSPAPELEKLRLALRPLKKLYGHTPACDFGPMALKAVRQEMVDSGLCRLTVNQRVSRVVRVFAFGVENELLPAGVHHALKAVSALKAGRSQAGEGRKVKPAPDADVDAVRSYVSRQLWAVIELQRLTGMRSGEALAMRGCDVDASRDVWVYTPARHKTEHHGKVRRVLLGPRAQEVLKPWLRRDPSEHLFQPVEAKEEHLARRRLARKTPMTPSQASRVRKKSPGKAPGDRYDTRTYSHAVERACSRAGVPRWHPHQLRHAAATNIRKEFGLEAARLILGHSSAAVAEIYAEADWTKAVEVARLLG